ncbi:MAG: metallophosphoesterase family protein [Clostridia bacterium]|nr:metallophosphoesterase family protein [Clostridia bacterium]
MLKFVRPDIYFRPGVFPPPAVKRVAIDGAPEFMRGLRIGFVSDVHLRRSVSDEKLGALIEKMRAMDADMILLGGDYAESPEDCARFFRSLSGIRPKYGIYGVFGNNDFICRDTLRDIMAESGVQLLLNEAAYIDLPGGRLWLAGCDDHKYGSPETKDIFPGGDYRILISHQPCMPECEAELMLSGHTHGGQFNFFGVTPYFIGFEFARKMLLVHGLKRIGNMQLLVGKGIGVSRLPIRIGAAAELYLIEFGKNLNIAES